MTIPFDIFFKEMTAGDGVVVYMFDNTVGFTSAKNSIFCESSIPRNEISMITNRFERQRESITYFEAKAIDPSIVEYTWTKVEDILELKPSFVIPKIAVATFKSLCESSFKNTVGMGGTAKDFTSHLEIRLKKLITHPPFYITSCAVKDTSCDCRYVYNRLQENGLDPDNMTHEQAKDAYDTLRKTKPYYKRIIPI